MALWLVDQCVCVCGCVCEFARALRIVSMDKIWRFTNISVVVINMINMCHASSRGSVNEDGYSRAMLLHNCAVHIMLS